MPDNNDEVDFSERQNLFQSAPAPRQFTVAGVVSTKHRRLEDAAGDVAPPSYTANTNKELLCLEYVANFRKQFEELLPDSGRPPLYLCPPNECGIPKFVCTTLRPTLLPFLELYNLEKLATFVSGLIEYEPLADPCKPPLCLPSPAAVLHWQSGDAFDLANLLVSFLIGSGYDAYVVNGFAPRWVCLLDQSRTICPFLDTIGKLDEAHDGKVNGESKVADDDTAVPKPTSKFVAMMEAKEEARRAEVAAMQDWTKHLDDDDDDDDDPLEGKRVHAWVLVRAGRRDVTEHVFIEPSTGRLYPVRDSPYVRIESVWNHQNYFVNMQPHRLSQCLYDLGHATDWEYVFLSSLEKKRIRMAKAASNNAGDGSDPGGENDEESNILDVPPSWVVKLHVERKRYKQRYVNEAQRATLYEKSKVEDFADNTHPQGMVRRLTLYRNRSRTLPIEIRELFKNRKDKLHLRIRYPLQGKFEEHFLPGRQPEALKSRIEWSGFRRELTFYTTARMDGLVKREELVHKHITETFSGRDDYLEQRSVTLSEEKDHAEAISKTPTPFVLPGGATGELTVRRMAEKFGRNPDRDADEDARKRTYNVREGTIRVQFHYAEGKITSASRVYHKAPNTPVDVFQVDPTAPRPKETLLERELQAAIQMEKECYNAIRHVDVETQEILKYRKREEAAITLETSIFDAEEDESKADAAEEQRKQSKEAKVEMDYLSPFLQAVGKHHHGSHGLTKDEAHAVRDLCLKNLKERLLERANIIQTRLDKENSALAKKQAAFQRSQREHDQGTDEEFERFCSETMFRIQILEQRLTRHEETALQKYAELDQRLHNEPRLAVLHQ
ncbi:hypothetical protein SPRG_10675 [Saprolegnia parasitica CBS 223.65]|uniref:Dynein regulatory complex subunit 7 n=1 Tax=Saprolegnia parasitica (strain CBS 223.65) TaxID=695850 RepID=A0A067C0B1_SAPPC|nr:hypothetical protein SPRG_10675 [Saprolegnia parasitica CBS 223.65]KDO23978.1 hypothetical protein SPRG_10675 [Saprolegnia parasitica CBS 223.65]|eukprot:XP_012205299.1 hypothetical protein SPRG_10675 [Saprolegnia parasitica CBS 223.65]